MTEYVFWGLMVGLLLFACWYLIRQFAHELGDLPDDYRFPDEEVRVD